MISGGIRDDPYVKSDHDYLIIHTFLFYYVRIRQQAIVIVQDNDHSSFHLPFQCSSTYIHIFEFCLRFTSHRMKNHASIPLVRTMLNTQRFDFFCFCFSCSTRYRELCTASKNEEVLRYFFEELQSYRILSLTENKSIRKACILGYFA